STLPLTTPLCLLLHRRVSPYFPSYSFFFQAEEGIRDGHVTGVQTCALPISFPPGKNFSARTGSKTEEVFAGWEREIPAGRLGTQIGRASCRERVDSFGVRVVGGEKKCWGWSGWGWGRRCGWRS